MISVSKTFTSAAAVSVLATGMLLAQKPASTTSSVEPNAGKWKTWVIPSGVAFRVPPPPGSAETRAELRVLNDAVTQVDDTKRAQIKHWDAGAPVYRWMDMLERATEAGQPLTAHPHRVYAYVALAMYDATVAAWESKYTYNRLRPSEMDHKLPTLVDVPRSPSYPSEHSAAASAAATVLAAFFPDRAQNYHAMAEQAGLSRVYAGVQFPSDHTAGKELGRLVAQKVIERMMSDGYPGTWQGTVPLGRCKWIGTNPGNAAAVQWRTLLLTWPNEFRPAPPPDCESTQIEAEVASVRTFPRTFASDQKAYYWQSPEGRETKPFILAEKWMFEDQLQQNPPRAARVYALLAAAHYDTFIASQDAKYAYWYLRPHQLDSGVKPLFAVPNFPSYPSNHSTFSYSRADMLAYLFPHRTADANAMAMEAANSRIWAGIHFPVDLEAGKTLGRAVARKFIQWAETDGSHE
ncbi:MAG TPA: phosphatase PAP2 family protein [Bryobacteraceae bacterium]|nr:phosphatase PAP2 family protein [Bryobacteraceae bacterium]